MTRIQLTQNQEAIIDDIDRKRVEQHRWFVVKAPKGRYFAATQIRNRKGDRTQISLQRFILQTPSGYRVHHKDGNRLNNRRENLETYRNGQNPRNGRRKAGPSFLGVYYDDRGYKRYRASITVARKCKHIGHYYTAEEAAKARDEAAFQQWGRDARLNFPRPEPSRATRKNASHGARGEGK